MHFCICPDGRAQVAIFSIIFHFEKMYAITSQAFAITIHPFYIAIYVYTNFITAIACHQRVLQL